MKVYCYCSYTGSPVGFHIGSLTYQPNRNGNYTLQKENIPSFIKRCFEQDMVRKGFGKLPGSDSGFFLLVKKLAAEGSGGLEASKYYINLALVTENIEEYGQWFQLNAEDASQGIAEAAKAMMEIDRSSEFGFTIRPEALTSLLRHSFGSLFPVNLINKPPKEANLELAISRNGNEIKEVLGLHDPDMTFYSVPDAPKWVCYRKKKSNCKPAPRSVLALLILAVMILLLGILFLPKIEVFLKRH